MQTKLFYSELIPEAAIARICEETGAGVELIQFSISDNLDRYAETMRQTREMLARCGNPDVAIHGPFLDLNPMSFDSGIRCVTMERFGQAYEAARELGADTIVYHSGMIPTVYFTEGWAERMVDFWQEFLRDRAGIRVCMENVLDREYEPVLAVAKQMTHPDFGLCLDIGHAHCYSEHPVLEWAEKLGPYVRHIHVHDNDRTRDAHLALGAGNLPWKEVLSAVQNRSCAPERLTCTVECSSEEAVRRSLKLLVL